MGVPDRNALVCQRCHATFAGKRRDARFCLPCRAARDQEHANRERPERYAQPFVGKGAYKRRSWPLVCIDCGNDFTARRTDAKRCAACAERDAKNREKQYQARRDSCPDCGQPKALESERCRSCAGKLRTPSGPDNPQYIGRTRTPKGYIYVRVDGTHPNSRSKWRGEHDVEWEKVHGPLPHSWGVHHLNGVKDDNRIENLLGLPNHEHHSHPHEAVKPYEARIRTLEARLQAAGLPID